MPDQAPPYRGRVIPPHRGRVIPLPRTATTRRAGTVEAGTGLAAPGPVQRPSVVPAKRQAEESPEPGPSRRRARHPEGAHRGQQTPLPDAGQDAALAELGLVLDPVEADGECQLNALLQSAPAAFPLGADAGQLRDTITTLARQIIDDPSHPAHLDLDYAIRYALAEEDANDAVNHTPSVTSPALSTPSGSSTGSPRTATATACWTGWPTATGPVRAATSPSISPPTPTR